MSIYKKIDGQDVTVAENSIKYHNQLLGRNVYGAHRIQDIRGLPEKLTANKKAIEDEVAAREAAIEAEAKARGDKDAEIVEAASGISLSEGQNGKLVFKNYAGQTNEVQGGYLPDGQTIQLENIDDEDKLVAVGLKTEEGTLTGNTINKDLTSLKSIVNAKGGYLDSYDFNKADPTQEELTQYAIQDIGDSVYFELGELTQEQFNSYNYLYTFNSQTETYNRIYAYDDTPGLIYYTINIWDKTRVINLYTNKTNHKNQDTWSWDFNSQTWSNLGNISLISDANNSGLHGLVTGAPNDGEHDYLGNIDNNGYININGLPELADKVNNQIINNKALASDENTYSAQYIDNNFAPLSFVSRLYLQKLNATNAELSNIAPEISPNNYLEPSVSVDDINWSTSLFTIGRILQADTTLNEETSFTTTLNFIPSRDCSLQFGARVKISEDNGATWTYIGSEQSFGQEDYSLGALSTTQFIVYTDLLTSNVSYETGTILRIEIYACLGNGDTTNTTLRIACGVELNTSNIYSYLQFNYQSVMINTDQITDGAITTSKIRDGAVTEQKLSQQLQDKINGKQDALIAGNNIDITNDVITTKKATEFIPGGIYYWKDIDGYWHLTTTDVQTTVEYVSNPTGDTAIVETRQYTLVENLTGETAVL